MEELVQSRVARGDGFGPGRKQLFLVALRQGRSVLGACRLVGVSNRTAYNHRRNDPKFAEAWELARGLSALPLELEAYRRAVEGEEDVVYAYGRPVGVRMRRSDALLVRLLEREKPELYGRAAGTRAQGKLKKKLARLAARLEALETRLDPSRLRGARDTAAVNFVNPRRASPRLKSPPNWRLAAARRRLCASGISPKRQQS